MNMFLYTLASWFLRLLNVNVNTSENADYIAVFSVFRMVNGLTLSHKIK